jgi:hypothetical protein
MADYNYSIGKFGNKDALPPGDPQKIVRGSDFEEEFPDISTAVNSKLNSNNPTFTGNMLGGTIICGTYTSTP